MSHMTIITYMVTPNIGRYSNKYFRESHQSFPHKGIVGHREVAGGEKYVTLVHSYAWKSSVQQVHGLQKNKIGGLNPYIIMHCLHDIDILEILPSFLKIHIIL